MMSLSFETFSPPMGKPRMTQRDKWAKRKCVQDYHAFADELRFMVGQDTLAMLKELSENGSIVDVSWVATFPMPQSWSKARKEQMQGQLHRVKPDRDNIDKAVLDVLFSRDQGIAQGTIKKVWGSEPGLRITVSYEPQPKQ